MNHWAKFVIMIAVVAALTVLAPIAGVAIGTAAIAVFHLTGIPATIVVTLAIVVTMVLVVKGAQWAVHLRRRRT